MDETDNLTAFCRVCLQLPDASQVLDVELIYDENENLTYADIFTITTKLDLLLEEPHNLCKLCGLELQMAYDFYKKVEASNRKLQEWHQMHEAVNLKFKQSTTADENEKLDVGEDPDAKTKVVYIKKEKSLSREFDEEYSIPDVQIKTEFSTINSSAENETQNNTIEPTIATSPIVLKRINNKIACDVCEKLFKNRSKMLWHRRMHDANRQRFPCPQADCDRLYTSKQSADLHFKQSHLNEGLPCAVCHKMFAMRKTLEVHMRYHTRNYPYECDICGKKFAQSSNLTMHRQVKHHNMRYVCEEQDCGKIFKNSISLRNHRFVHTHMPFECFLCGKGYPQKSKLKVHINLKHNMELTLHDIESMRQFRDARTRHSFVHLSTIESTPNIVKKGVVAKKK